MITALAKRENWEDAALILWLIKGCQLTIVDKAGQQKKRLVYVDDFTGVLRKQSVGILAVDGTKPIIDLSEVSNVIDGSFAETLSHDWLYQFKDCCFSLSYANGCKRLYFVAHNPSTKWAWVRGLTLLVARLSASSHYRQSTDDIVNYEFQVADRNKDGLISSDEALTILNQLHLPLNHEYVDKLFQKAKSEVQSGQNTTKGHLLDRKQFLHLVKLVSHCPEIRLVFDQARGNFSYLNGIRFKEFLQIQENKAVIDHATMGNLVRKYELCFALRGNDSLSYEGFRAFLLSEDNSIHVPESLTEVYHNMTKPLSQYWIFSSHNTYVVSEQFSGECSLNGYASALRRGCRSIQVDTWDGIDDEPIVTNHGQMYTSKLYFRDVLRTVRDDAFTASPYPVILSIENHCSLTQQRRMIYHLKNILDDMICTSAIDPKQVDQLLSPEALKFKILIKSRSLTGNYYYQQQPHVQQALQLSFSNQSLSRPVSNLSANSRSSYNIAHSGTSSATLLSNFASGRISPELSQFIALPSIPMPKFNRPQQIQLPVHGVSALVESEAQSLAENFAAEVRSHTSKNLVRVYPSAMRAHSSNYNPFPALLAGFQLVSLNFQTRDKHFKIYNGFFRDNGQCGYLLKPCLAPTHCRLVQTMVLRIQIVSGYQLCSNYRPPVNNNSARFDSIKNKKPNAVRPAQEQTSQTVDPYVMLFIHGVNEDRMKYQTSVIANNGFNPVWNEAFIFRITRPDVALLRFVAANANGGFSFIGQYSLPIRLCRPGLRSVRLDCDNPRRNSVLLVHVSIQAET